MPAKPKLLRMILTILEVGSWKLEVGS